MCGVASNVPSYRRALNPTCWEACDLAKGGPCVALRRVWRPARACLLDTRENVLHTSRIGVSFEQIRSSDPSRLIHFALRRGTGGDDEEGLTTGAASSLPG
jgi:hypothetical protein